MRRGTRGRAMQPALGVILFVAASLLFSAAHAADGASPQHAMHYAQGGWVIRSGLSSGGALQCLLAPAAVGL